MSETPPPFDAPSLRQHQDLARAMRFAVGVIVLAISCFNILSALSIAKFGVIFQDMLGGKALPAATAFVLTTHSALIALSFLIPVAAIALLFPRSLIWRIYLSIGLVLIALLQLVFTNIALMAPLAEVLNGMANPGPP